jgi:excisionase family DNA binding protein
MSYKPIRLGDVMDGKPKGPAPAGEKTGEKAAALTLSVPEAGALLGLGRSKSYQEAAAGRIPTKRYGKLLRVPRVRFLRSLEED